MVYSSTSSSARKHCLEYCSWNFKVSPHIHLIKLKKKNPTKLNHAPLFYLLLNKHSLPSQSSPTCLLGETVQSGSNCSVFTLSTANDGAYPHLNFEGSLKSTSKEASKWPNKGGKSRQCNAVDLEGIHPDCLLQGKTKKPQHVTGGFPPGITLLTSCPFFSLNHALGQLLFKWVHVPPDLEQLHWTFSPNGAPLNSPLFLDVPLSLVMFLWIPPK